MKKNQYIPHEVSMRHTFEKLGTPVEGTPFKNAQDSA